MVLQAEGEVPRGPSALIVRTDLQTEEAPLEAEVVVFAVVEEPELLMEVMIVALLPTIKAPRKAIREGTIATSLVPRKTPSITTIVSTLGYPVNTAPLQRLLVVIIQDMEIMKVRSKVTSNFKTIGSALEGQTFGVKRRDE
ncbi:hypothetical protein PHLCEN_2v2849 [Hermanssonia centrifuga]|uniref:Uncharacterized protein n=1 Tax=Hermanssonia centrifuga TaxID=98765 RepID=A0A2R6RI57_9APHY|nr:hypothetical protein PHLCEN_2v2849 [Hermanssonia centrifuga]